MFSGLSRSGSSFDKFEKNHQPLKLKALATGVVLAEGMGLASFATMYLSSVAVLLPLKLKALATGVVLAEGMLQRYRMAIWPWPPLPFCRREYCDRIAMASSPILQKGIL